jgi:hypothetical protein
MKILRVITLLVLLLIPIADAASMPPESTEPPSMQRSPPTAQTTDNNADSMRVSESLAAAKGRHDRNEFTGFFERYEKVIMGLGTLILAVATGFLWWATRALVVGAEETAQRQLRAYVCVDGVELRNFGTSKGVEIAIRFKNVGLTPAYEVKNRYSIDLEKFPKTSLHPMHGSKVVSPWDRARSLIAEYHSRIALSLTQPSTPQF